MNDESRNNAPQSRGISATEIRTGLRRNHILAVVAIILACIAIVFSMFVFTWFQWIDTSDDSINTDSGVYYTDDGVAYTYDLIVFHPDTVYPDYLEVCDTSGVSESTYDSETLYYFVGDCGIKCRAVYLDPHYDVSRYLHLTLSSDSYLYFYGYDNREMYPFGIEIYDYFNTSYSNYEDVIRFSLDRELGFEGYVSGFLSAGDYYLTSGNVHNGQYYCYMIVVTPL